LEDQNDGASSSRNTNFKPLLLNEIQAGGDNAIKRRAGFAIIGGADQPQNRCTG
jgi:hypothetical protein